MNEVDPVNASQCLDKFAGSFELLSQQLMCAGKYLQG
jgi:hypothetical protein